MVSGKSLMENLRCARYSRLEVMVFLLIFVSSVVFAARWALERKAHFLIEAVQSNRLPAVQLSPAAEPSSAEEWSKSYRFSFDWQTRNIPFWRTALARFQGQPNVSYLEIGVYEGRSFLWMLEHILTGPGARATGVDIFDGPYKQTYFQNIELSGLSDRVTTVTGPSQVILRGLPLASFDVIYIDGSHRRSDVLEDAVLSWRLLKPHGLMIFDDYGSIPCADVDDSAYDCPKLAIDAFLECFSGQYKIIHNGWQLMVLKE